MSAPTTLEAAIEVLKTHAEPEKADGMAAYRIAFARGDGMWWEKEKTYNAARGIPMVGVAAWLRTHRT